MKSRHLLMGRLYQADELQHNETGVSVTIRLNREDDVFRGHFPGHSLLPGVCTVQIIKEVLSEAVAKDLRLNKAANIKFLAFIDPHTNESVQLDLQFAYREETRIACNARVYSGPVSFCSFKGEFTVQKQPAAAMS